MNPLGIQFQATEIRPRLLLSSRCPLFFFFSQPHLPLTHHPSSISLTLKPKPSPPPISILRRRRRCRTIAASSSSADHAEIDMARNRDGIYAPRRNKVVVLWDLDNKPPRGPPYAAAVALKRVAQRFGDVVEMAAYANRHAFVHLPGWVRDERRQHRNLDILERKGLSAPAVPYVCGVCGRKFRTNWDLKKHFKQLHQRERQKKLNRMRSLKGKKRQRFKERFISGNHKYEEAARVLVKPKAGYGLASELRRAGVLVKTVEDKPQAADWALKKQMQHSMNKGVDWMFLVSDDSDFSVMLKKVKDSKLGTVVVGDRDQALGQLADFWVPWIGVENGEILDEDFESHRRKRMSEFLDRNKDDELFCLSHFDGEMANEGNLDTVVDELAAIRSEIDGLRISAFSEGEDEDDNFDDVTVGLSWDSDDGGEEIIKEDWNLFMRQTHD